MEGEQNETYALLQPAYLNFLAGTADSSLKLMRLRGILLLIKRVLQKKDRRNDLFGRISNAN
jgi:hypothetical protein